MSFPDGLKVIEEWGANINEPLTLYNAGPANIFDSPESRPWLKVVCRRYRPTPGACCSKSWTKGTEKIDIHLPTYAMTEYQLRGAAKTMNDLIDAGYKKLVAKLANGQDEIISWTLAEAIRQAETVSIWTGRCIEIAN